MTAAANGGGQSAPDELVQAIQKHSKSFALAAKLLPPQVNYDAVVLYAYCRHADDAIDLCPIEEQAARLLQLRAELDQMYSGVQQNDPLLDAVQQVIRSRAVPRRYFEELLAGMEMDSGPVRYQSLPELMVYCYRVAGVVGLMMCHVMGVRDSAALRHAAHLGMAMQLTNIARDVHEDWQRGRLYLPHDILTACGAGDLPALGTPLPLTAAEPLARATAALLDEAERYYRSGDEGLCYLSARSALAIRAARWVYSEIGQRLRAQACNPFAPRAVVSHGRKLQLVAYASWLGLRALPTTARSQPRLPSECVTDPSSLFMSAGA
jgi:phytoene synthase